MSFLKRFGWYLMGLSIGLIFLAVFLSKKRVEFCYMPNCRVLKSLRSKPLETGADLSTAPDTLAIAYLLQEGDVRFKESTPRAEPCGIYVVQGEYQEQSLRLTLQNCDSVTRLVDYQALPR